MSPRALVSIVVAGAVGVTVVAVLWSTNGRNDAEPTPVDPSADETHRDPTTRPAELSPEAITRLLTMSPLPPPPADPSNAYADDPVAAHFGRFLFFDDRLSGDYASATTAELDAFAPVPVSCAHCHQPERAFTDGSAIAHGLGPGKRNTPTILNTAHNRWFNWDGRRDSHWAQAIEAIERPNEMGSNRLAIAHLVHTQPDLNEAYQRIFGPPPPLSPSAPRDARPAHDDDPEDAAHPHVIAWASVSEADRRAANTIIVNIAKAIAAYQRQLESRDAPFDTFVRGLRTSDAAMIEALAPQQRRGAELFATLANCWQCHHGPNLSDGEFHSVNPPLPGGPSVMPRDAGRFAGIPVVQADPFNAQGRYADDPLAESAQRLDYLHQSPEAWGAFKTPSLRSVALTAPYFHHGHMADLAAVLQHYNTFADSPRVGHGHRDPMLQPLNLSDVDLAALEAFLRSLTGAPIADELLRPPASPLPSDQQ